MVRYIKTLRLLGDCLAGFGVESRLSFDGRCWVLVVGYGFGGRRVYAYLRLFNFASRLVSWKEVKYCFPEWSNHNFVVSLGGFTPKCFGLVRRLGFGWDTGHGYVYTCNLKRSRRVKAWRRYKFFGLKPPRPVRGLEELRRVLEGVAYRVRVWLHFKVLLAIYHGCKRLLWKKIGGRPVFLSGLEVLNERGIYLQPSEAPPLLVRSLRNQL